MAQQIDTKAWLDRLQNLLDVQKDMQLEWISTRFTRYDLIELRTIIGTLADMENIKMHTPGVCDTIKCGHAKEWWELRNDLEADGYELNFLPNMTIQITGEKEEK